MIFFSTFSIAEGSLRGVRRSVAADLGVGIGDVRGGAAETRVEELGNTWHLLAAILRFSRLCMCDSTALIPVVLSLKHFLH